MEPVELQARRRALGLGQQDLADMLGIKQATLSHWERGARPIPPGVDTDLAGVEREQEESAVRLARMIAHKAETLDADTVEMEVTGDLPGLPAAFQQTALALAARRAREAGIVVRIISDPDQH